MKRLEHQVCQQDIGRKNIDYIIIFLIFISSFTVKSQIFHLTERKLYHLDKEKKYFLQGSTSTPSIKIKIINLTKNNNRIHIIGITNYVDTVRVFFVEFYKVDKNENDNSYKIIKHLGSSDIDGYFNIRTTLNKKEKIFLVDCYGESVSEVVPELFKFDKVKIKEKINNK